MTNTPQDRIDMAAKQPESDPKVLPGATVCDTPESIERFRMMALLHALKLEAKGIRAFRGSALSAARRLYGIKARTATVAAERLEDIMLAKGIINA